MMRLLMLAMTIGLLFAGEAPAQTTPPAPGKSAQRSGPLAGFGANSKEPIRIEAAKLQVYDKEQRAVYSGDVVAVQGKSTLRCTQLTIFYDQRNNAAGSAPASDTNPNSSIRKLDCKGPVSVVSCTQTATGDHGVYEAATDKVVLTGNVVLADGPNVQNGDKLVYDLKDGTATVTGGRVGGIFIPGSDTAKRDKEGPKAKSSDSCK